MRIDQNTLIGFGIAALMPGMRHMLEVMEGTVREYREMLDQLQSGNIAALMPNGAKKRGRPSKAMLEARAIAEAQNPAVAKYLVEAPAPTRYEKVASKHKAYWDAMTPEERALEVRRRMNKTAATKRAKAKAAAAPAETTGLRTREEIASELQLSKAATSKLLTELGIRAKDFRGKWGLYSASAFAKIQKAATKKTQNPIAAYWAAMTPEQRKAEMARRVEKGLGRKAA